MRKGRILALDYGPKNVGVACCDELQISIRPLPSIPYRSKRDLVLRLRRIIEDNQILAMVVGIPLHMNGSSGVSVRRVERFMHFLRTELGLPLEGVDERLSTVEASEIWSSMSLRKQKRYRTVDSLAAAFILQRFIRES